MRSIQAGVHDLAASSIPAWHHDDSLTKSHNGGMISMAGDLSMLWVDLGYLVGFGHHSPWHGVSNYLVTVKADGFYLTS